MWGCACGGWGGGGCLTHCDLCVCISQLASRLPKTALIYSYVSTQTHQLRASQQKVEQLQHSLSSLENVSPHTSHCWPGSYFSGQCINAGRCIRYTYIHYVHVDMCQDRVHIYMCTYVRTYIRECITDAVLVRNARYISTKRVHIPCNSISTGP